MIILQIIFLLYHCIPFFCIFWSMEGLNITMFSNNLMIMLHLCTYANNLMLFVLRNLKYDISIHMRI